MQEILALAGSSYPLHRLGRHDEARRRLHLAFSRLQDAKFYPAERIAPGSAAETVLRAMADEEAVHGNIARAIEIYEELLGKALASSPKPETSLTDAVNMSTLYGALAALHRLARHSERASALQERRLTLWRHWDTRLPNNSFVTRQLKAATAHL
jgi:hypothetical protein